MLLSRMISMFVVCTPICAHLHLQGSNISLDVQHLAKNLIMNPLHGKVKLRSLTCQSGLRLARSLAILQHLVSHCLHIGVGEIDGCGNLVDASLLIRVPGLCVLPVLTQLCLHLAHLGGNRLEVLKLLLVPIRSFLFDCRSCCLYLGCHGVQDSIQLCCFLLCRRLLVRDLSCLVFDGVQGLCNVFLQILQNCLRFVLETNW
mmetsp:Transcript_43120/g.99332  ORF Transcript_43120/g.99332 Transcript_43120/m.99332 type:complete len:202 (-) Transcript_43120:811-1416(-)